MHEYKFGVLGVVEVPLKSREIRACLTKGVQRTQIDEEQLGWRYRHNGLPSNRAHGIGLIGELAFQKFLNRHGVIYQKGEDVVHRHEDIKQDFTISGLAWGVKTADKSALEAALAYPSFLYPAKKLEGESSRVLPYPDYLVQAVASTEKQVCWLCGFTTQQDILEAPTRIINGFPAHQIPLDRYHPLKMMFGAIR